MTTDEVKEYFKDVVGVVEDPHFERLCLWKENKTEWIESRGGYNFTVGHINNRPICSRCYY